MVKGLLLLLLITALISCNVYKSKPLGRTVNETIEWSNTWMVNTNDKDIPRVLLIGDSHVEAYYQKVADGLQSLAYCCKFTSSKSLGDPVLIDQLNLIFKQYDFDVICFNNGLHGGAYSEKQYGKFVPLVYDLLKKHSRKAIIWINTTATRNPEHLDEFTKFNNQVIARNKIVSDFTGAIAIPLLDSYLISASHADYYSKDGVHFNQAGINAEANMIIDKVKTFLK